MPSDHDIMLLLLLCLACRVMDFMASRRIMLLCLPRRLRDALHGVPSHDFAATIVVIAMDSFFFLALACRGTLPRVSQVCANVRMVAGGHCTLGGARMMEASVFLRSP